MSTKPGQTSSGVISPRRRDRAEPGLGARADVLEAGVAADGQRAAADDLHPRVLLRVVRGGDADAAVEPELADRVVDHLGADHPEVADVGAAVRGPLHHRRRHRRRREAHVAPDRDRARLEVLDVRATDRVRAFLVELGAVEAADVVRLEDSRVEHVPIVFDLAGPRPQGPYPYPSEMERKLATVLFADLVGSTQLVASADPEVVRSRLTRFFDQVVALHHRARRHRREVRRRRGDGRVRRPARARGRPGARGPGGARDRRGGRSSGSRCGSGSSPARSSSDETETTFATGLAINAAARLQQAAQPGSPARPDRRAAHARHRRHDAARGAGGARASRPGSRPGASSRSPRRSVGGSSSRCRSSGARRSSSCSTTRSPAPCGTAACTS